MAVVSLTILGKNCEPLFIKDFSVDQVPMDDRASEEELFGLPVSVSQERRGTGCYRSSPPRRIGNDCSLRHQFILHAALDRFEQLSGPPPGYGWRSPGVAGTDAMFVGLLAPVEDMRVYGYMTTTQIRFILAVEDHLSSAGTDQRRIDEAIKRVFVKLHRLYVEYVLNPFCSLTGPITSARFDLKVEECVSAYNRTIK